MEGRLLEARPAQVADLSSWQGGVSSALRLCGSFLGSPWRPPPALSALVSPQAGSPSSCQGIQCGALPTSAPGPADGSAVMSASQESRAARGHPVCPRLRPPVLGLEAGKGRPSVSAPSLGRGGGSPDSSPYSVFVSAQQSLSSSSSPVCVCLIFYIIFHRKHVFTVTHHSVEQFRMRSDQLCPCPLSQSCPPEAVPFN